MNAKELAQGLAQSTMYNDLGHFICLLKTICHSPEELGVSRMEQAIASTRYKLFSIGPPEAVSQPAASKKLLLLLVADDLAAGKISWHLWVCEDIHISLACLGFLEVLRQLIKSSCFLKSKGYNKPCSSWSYSSKKTQDPFSTTVCMVRSSPCVANAGWLLWTLVSSAGPPWSARSMDRASCSLQRRESLRR